MSTIWALDDFTEDNGATRIVPGSHHSNGDRPDESAAQPVIMPAGSLLIFLGTLYHGGGKNRSSGTRLGLTIQYCPRGPASRRTSSSAYPRARCPNCLPGSRS